MRPHDIFSRVLPLLAILWCTTTLADVKATIDGPTTGNAGDLIVLDGSKSIGDGWKWLLPDGLQTLSCGANDTPGQVAFAVGKPGRYTFALILADKEAAIDYVSHTVTIGGTLPGPTPDPPPEEPEEPDQPTPVPELERLERLSTESAARLADAVTARGLAEAIMSVERQIEAMCASGQCPGLSAAKAMMVGAIERRLLARTGSSRDVNWIDGWRVPIDTRIKSLNPQDVPTYRAMMRAVAIGLTK